jgi:hypothetical protein
MPATWNICGDLVTLTITAGANGDLGRAIGEAMSSRKFPATPSVLFDVRRATENPTPEILRLRAGRIATLVSRRPGSRCALVVGPRPHQYGLARMLSVFLGTEGIESEVFTKIREARRWLAPAGGRKVLRAGG